MVDTWKHDWFAFSLCSFLLSWTWIWSRRNTFAHEVNVLPAAIRWAKIFEWMKTFCKNLSNNPTWWFSFRRGTSESYWTRQTVSHHGTPRWYRRFNSFMMIFNMSENTCTAEFSLVTAVRSVWPLPRSASLCSSFPSPALCETLMQSCLFESFLVILLIKRRNIKHNVTVSQGVQSAARPSVWWCCSLLLCGNWSNSGM